MEYNSVVIHSILKSIKFKDGFPLIFGYFSLSKGQTALRLFIHH